LEKINARTKLNFDLLFGIVFFKPKTIVCQVKGNMLEIGQHVYFDKKALHVGEDD